MALFLLLMGTIILCFAFVLLRGAPYVPTLGKQVETALDLVDLKRGETLLELGCGDGKVLVAAAKRGWNVVGYELNPLLALIAWIRIRPYKDLARVECKDFWVVDWPPAEGIFVFLLDSFMQKLDTKIVQSFSHKHKSVKLVSFAFQVPGKAPVREKDGLFLYEYK
jgi:SAM-dependent methyltransferase